MTEAQKTYYNRLKKLGKSRAFMTEKERRREQLVAEGAAKDRAAEQAFVDTMALPEFSLPPAEETHGQRRVREEQEKQPAPKRLSESLAAWERFHVTAGKSDSLEEWLRWAIEAATLAHEPGSLTPMWQKVKRPPPDM